MSLVARCFVSPKTGKAESEREIEKETVRQKERGRGRIKCPIGAQTHASCPKLSVSLLPATAAEASPRIEFNSQQVRLRLRLRLPCHIGWGKLANLRASLLKSKRAATAA